MKILSWTCLLGFLFVPTAPPDGGQVRMSLEESAETLAERGADPRAHLGLELEMAFTSARLEERWNPFLTPFDPQSWIALRGWSDEQFPWREADWYAPALRFFVAREGPLAAWARTLPPYQRWKIRGVPRAFFANEAWIEVTGVEALETAICEGTVIHASRALEAIEEGRFAGAAADLDRALAAPLPEPARAELERLRASCDQGAAAQRR